MPKPRRRQEAYVHWIERYIFFHHKRHPAEMGKQEITQFLTALAVDRHVSASTQNQAPMPRRCAPAPTAAGRCKCWNSCPRPP
ncbi:MAG: phage integrase N-terminal SAM-like domain-containing protein [Deltaproteobacteria bacterium]|nr:phage integrase N-terminal SAM-like domain-containing protein [Deltaproteobacteria bacterium]